MRDKIPEIIEAQGRQATTRRITGGELDQALKAKLQEEIDEFLASDDPAELADILEVVEALASSQEISFEKLLQMKASKRMARGGFTRGVFLE